MGHDDGQRGCKKDNHPRAPLKCCFNERRGPRMRKHSCPTLLLQHEMTERERVQFRVGRPETESVHIAKSLT